MDLPIPTLYLESVTRYFQEWVKYPSISGDFKYSGSLPNIYVGKDFILDVTQFGELKHKAKSGAAIQWYFGGDDYRVQVSYYIYEHTLYSEIAGRDEETVTALRNKIFDLKIPRPSAVDNVVPYRFWSWTGMNANDRSKDIIVDRYEDIKDNYSENARYTVDSLMDLKDPKDAGRILIFHGPAGTGKTSLIRSLSKEWSDWASFEVAQDPENMLNISSYLTSIILDQNEEPDRWRVVVLEDCDELISKTTTSQQLSKILNAGDGLLGQGTKIMFLLTANDSFAHLHPAISRPGRCLANVEIGRLSYDEAVKWLGTTDGLPVTAVSDGITLAELYAIKRGDLLHTKKKDTSKTGQYV